MMLPRLRPFGTEAADLAIDFDAPNRAALVTRLLAQCAVGSGDAPREVYRDLTAGQRLECVLRLAAAPPRHGLTLQCRCGACRQDLELELTIEELAGLQRAADLVPAVSVDVGGRQLSFRKPTGRDLEAWAGVVFDDQPHATAVMVAALAGEPAAIAGLEAASLGAVDEALAAADPLIDFRCEVQCHVCGAATECAVDLLAVACDVLRREQRSLLASVHQLASHYHWSERQIFAVPAWRRQRYLQLIAGAER